MTYMRRFTDSNSRTYQGCTLSQNLRRGLSVPQENRTIIFCYRWYRKKITRNHFSYRCYRKNEPLVFWRGLHVFTVGGLLFYKEFQHIRRRFCAGDTTPLGITAINIVSYPQLPSPFLLPLPVTGNVLVLLDDKYGAYRRPKRGGELAEGTEQHVVSHRGW